VSAGCVHLHETRTVLLISNQAELIQTVSTSGGSDYTGQAGCVGAQEGRGPWGEEAFWNPGGRRRGGRGELQGPCNHCFAEGKPYTCRDWLCNVHRLCMPYLFHLRQELSGRCADSICSCCDCRGLHSKLSLCSIYLVAVPILRDNLILLYLVWPLFIYAPKVHCC